MSKLLFVDDDAHYRELIPTLLADQFTVDVCEDGESAIDTMADGAYPVVITDLLMPGMDGLELTRKILANHPDTIIILLSAADSVTKAVEAMKIGAFDYLIKGGTMEELQSNLFRTTSRIKLYRENLLLRDQLTKKTDSEYYLDSSNSVFQQLLKEAELVADTDSTVLITGENGTGKEVMAKYIHGKSQRADKQMIIVNCAALSEDLLASELFGHVKGAFTGAYKNHRGYFEIADNCTIFLDEIAEISMNMQVKLLRVLQDKKFTRVGETSVQSTNVRIIAATNRNLADEIQNGNFREDLYFRLNVFEFKLPPLRERSGDILNLFRLFLTQFSERTGKKPPKIAKELEGPLISYSWPGNIRELGNLAERAVILSQGKNSVGAEILPDKMKTGAVESAGATLELDNYSAAKKENQREFDISYISYKLRQHRGNVAATARTIGVHPVSLRQKIAKLDIDLGVIKDEFR